MVFGLSGILKPVNGTTRALFANMTTANFILLPNGDLIRLDSIKAVRLGDARPGLQACESDLKPRVIIDFEVGRHGNCVVCDCETVEFRDKLAAQIREKLKI